MRQPSFSVNVCEAFDQERETKRAPRNRTEENERAGGATAAAAAAEGIKGRARLEHRHYSNQQATETISQKQEEKN